MKHLRHFNEDIEVYSGKGGMHDLHTRLGEPAEDGIENIQATEEGEENILVQVSRDLERFRPPGGGKSGEINMNKDSVSKDFRHLGNWINGEQDRSDDDFDDSDWEDNDQRIWAPGEYQKWKNYFIEWAKNYSWFNKVDLYLSTSEKDWCEFTVSLKKKK
jgi:hypothetical protein